MRLILFIVSLLIFSQGFSQEASPAKSSNQPFIGVGVNTIGFYGDLNDRDYDSPINGNRAFNFYLLQPLNNYLNLRLEFMTGNIREDERTLQRNVNFTTSLRGGAAYIEYNFNHFLPANRKITPFFTTGVQMVEFNPKTDLLDANGEPYNYWSDGSIRDIAENSPQAANAVLITRDFKYETDIREAGFNSSTSYMENSLAIPLGVGVIMHLNDQFDFRIQSSIHFTFTDYIDGVTPSTSRNFVDQKRGNGRNDHFLLSGFSVSYRFQKVEPASPYDFDLDEPFDFLAYGNTEDFDEDGVIDLVDDCPNTPRGLDVDTTGCPVDTDKDGVPDYKDEEINTEYPEFANAQGVEMSDEMLYKSYLMYIDSTLGYAEVIERDFTGSNQRRRKLAYRVKIESHEKGSTPENINKLLAISDLSKFDQGDQTIYTVGKYATESEANSRANQMKAQGFEQAGVLKKLNNGDYREVVSTSEPIANNENADQPSTIDPSEENGADQNTNKVVFRVQLGAFKNQPSAEAFRSIPNLIVVESGGYYRYMSGAFDTFEEAAKHKVKMVVKDYKGAFVVAYKNGKRVSLKSVGVESISSDPIIGR